MDLDDALLAELGDSIERQLAYEILLPENLVAFIFTLKPYVDRRSKKMGVCKRHYTANLHQRGKFVEHQRLNQALSDAVHTSLRQLITNEQIPG